MLAYLQLRSPLADVLMQNAAFPIVWDFCMLLPDEGEPIVPCAWAKETPATSAATAARVVNVFIVCLLVWRRCSGNSHDFGKKFQKGVAKRQAAGKVPGRRPKIVAIE
jgi:hypothetical protein